MCVQAEREEAAGGAYADEERYVLGKASVDVFNCVVHALNCVRVDTDEFLRNLLARVLHVARSVLYVHIDVTDGRMSSMHSMKLI